jgi:NAD(P)-dependent dehydrogenase (short-subunit alcohol dehydrogenase family)
LHRKADTDTIFIDWCLDGHRGSLRNGAGSRGCYARTRLQNGGTKNSYTANDDTGSIADSYQAKLSALQKKLQASNTGSKIIYKVADVGDYEAVDAAVASAVEELGRIDILINNVRHILGH